MLVLLLVMEILTPEYIGSVLKSVELLFKDLVNNRDYT